MHEDVGVKKVAAGPRACLGSSRGDRSRTPLKRLSSHMQLYTSTNVTYLRLDFCALCFRRSLLLHRPHEGIDEVNLWLEDKVMGEDDDQVEEGSQKPAVSQCDDKHYESQSVDENSDKE